MFDKRKKIARSNEQEYAHHYTPKTREEEYQYPNEDYRVTNHINGSENKSREELYNVQPEESVITPTQSNKIKVRVNPKDIREDHRQRSYKIRTQPQINGRTSFEKDKQINNDPRQDEIERIRETSKVFAEQIEKENNADLTNPVERYAEENVENITFNVGDKVAHVEENINGEIKFVNDKRLSVVWEDNTRERFTIKEASEFLKITKAYVGDIQELIDPINTPDWPKNEELERKLDNTLSSVEKEVDEEIENTEIDIEKIKLQRKVSELEDKVNEIDVEKIKTKAANEVISLMQKKGLLSDNEQDIKEQFEAIMSMDDIAFESFKKAIVSAKTKEPSSEEDEIYAMLGEDEDYSDIEDGMETAKAMDIIKKETTASRSIDGIEMGDTSFLENGGLANFKANIGDFSGLANMDFSNEPQTRSLSSAASSNRKPIQKKANHLDMSGFQNIQGLKTPINIPSKDVSTRGKFAELFENLGWSGVPKDHKF